MGGYVGTTKRDIEYLIDSVSEPGVSVKREVRTKLVHTAVGGVNILYHFYKDNKKLFSVCILPKGNSLSNDSFIWANAELSVLRNSASSDVLCKGDEGFRKMCVLCQLAEKMYETQSTVKNLQNKQTQLKNKVVGEIASRRK